MLEHISVAKHLSIQKLVCVNGARTPTMMGNEQGLLDCSKKHLAVEYPSHEAEAETYQYLKWNRELLRTTSNSFRHPAKSGPAPFLKLSCSK